MNSNTQNSATIFDSTYKQNWQSKGIDDNLCAPIKLKRISFDALQTDISNTIDQQLSLADTQIESDFIAPQETNTKILKFGLIESENGGVSLSVQIANSAFTKLAFTDVEAALAKVFDHAIGNNARVSVDISSINLVSEGTYTLDLAVKKFIDWANYDPDEPF